MRASILGVLCILLVGCETPAPVSAPDRSQIVAESLQFVVNGRTVFTVAYDGRVILGEGVSLDEASHVFWADVARRRPHLCWGGTSKDAE